MIEFIMYTYHSSTDACVIRYLEEVKTPLNDGLRLEHKFENNNPNERRYVSLRIQICPKKGISPIILFFSDGIGTQKILF